MAELFGTAAGVLQVAEVGFNLATTLYKYATTVKGAERDIKRIARDVKLTSKVLERTHQQLKADQQGQLATDDALFDLEDVLDGCREAFQEVDEALNKSMKPAGGKSGISLTEKLKWPLKQDKLEVLRANLEKLKTTLLLMLSVLAYGSKVQQSQASKTDIKVELSLEKLQIQNLIQAKDEATSRYEELSAAFAKLEARINNSAQNVQPPSISSIEANTISMMAIPPQGLPPLEPNGRHREQHCKDQPHVVAVRLGLCASAVSKLTTTIDAATKRWESHQILEHDDISQTLKETTDAVESLRQHVMSTANPLPDATTMSEADLSKMAIRESGPQNPAAMASDVASRPVHRVDCAQDGTESVPQLTPERRTQRNGRASPLRVRTDLPAAAAGSALQDEYSTKSPTLSKHIIQVDEKAASILPPVRGTSSTTATIASPSRKESLPTFRQLADLADIASQQTLDRDRERNDNNSSTSIELPPSNADMSPTDHHDYILDLADPQRSSSTDTDSKRIQKHPASFQCQICQKLFTRAYNLRSHLRTHTVVVIPPRRNQNGRSPTPVLGAETNDAQQKLPLEGIEDAHRDFEFSDAFKLRHEKHQISIRDDSDTEVAGRPKKTQLIHKDEGPESGQSEPRERPYFFDFGAGESSQEPTSTRSSSSIDMEREVDIDINHLSGVGDPDVRSRRAVEAEVAEEVRAKLLAPGEDGSDKYPAPIQQSKTPEAQYGYVNPAQMCAAQAMPPPARPRLGSTSRPEPLSMDAGYVNDSTRPGTPPSASAWYSYHPQHSHQYLGTAPPSQVAAYPRQPHGPPSLASPTTYPGFPGYTGSFSARKMNPNVPGLESLKPTVGNLTRTVSARRSNERSTMPGKYPEEATESDSASSSESDYSESEEEDPRRRRRETYQDPRSHERQHSISPLNSPQPLQSRREQPETKMVGTDRYSDDDLFAIPLVNEKQRKKQRSSDNGDLTPRANPLSQSHEPKTQPELPFATGNDEKKRRGRHALPGRCHSCGRSETPEWRRGPDGARSLCNDCGIRYQKLTRDAARGSNQHRQSSLAQQAPNFESIDASQKITVPGPAGNATQPAAVEETSQMKHGQFRSAKSMKRKNQRTIRLKEEVEDAHAGSQDKALKEERLEEAYQREKTKARSHEDEFLKLKEREAEEREDALIRHREVNKVPEVEDGSKSIFALPKKPVSLNQRAENNFEARPISESIPPPSLAMPSRPSPPKLTLAKPMGSSQAPNEGVRGGTGGLPLFVGSRPSNYARTESFGANTDNPASSSASSHSALNFMDMLRDNDIANAGTQGPKPASLKLETAKPAEHSESDARARRRRSELSLGSWDTDTWNQPVSRVSTRSSGASTPNYGMSYQSKDEPPEEFNDDVELHENRNTTSAGLRYRPQGMADGAATPYDMNSPMAGSGFTGPDYGASFSPIINPGQDESGSLTAYGGGFSHRDKTEVVLGIRRPTPPPQPTKLGQLLEDTRLGSWTDDENNEEDDDDDESMGEGPDAVDSLLRRWTKLS